MDVREEIAEYLRRAIHDTPIPYIEQADQILALDRIAVLAEDQELPIDILLRDGWSKDLYYAYCRGQKALIHKNWRKVEL